MGLDKEMIRSILIDLEFYNDVELDVETSYQMDMLIEQGLVNAEQLLKDGRVVFYQGLTLSWTGYELLASVSNKYVWESIKDRLNDRDMTVNDVPFNIVEWMAQDILKGMFGNGNNL